VLLVDVVAPIVEALESWREPHRGVESKRFKSLVDQV